jgi:hypothetical protein
VTTDECPRAVGLLFAGSSSSTILNPIGDVLSELNTKASHNVKMVGACTATSSSTSSSTESPTITVPASGALGRELRLATQVRDRNEPRLMGVAGVVGTGISADASGNAVIQVYVKEMTALVQNQVPSVLGGVAVQIVETGEFVAF